jgi:hypothetical protein
MPRSMTSPLVCPAAVPQFPLRPQLLIRQSRPSQWRDFPVSAWFAYVRRVTCRLLGSVEIVRVMSGNICEEGNG